MPRDVILLPPRVVLPPTDEADEDRCRAAFNPIWPYVCAALRGDDHTHVHFGQSSRWPRQPDFPPVPFEEEYDPMSVVSACLS